MKKHKDTTEEKLKEEIERQLELAKTLPAGSEEQTNVVHNAAELYKMRIDTSTAKTNKISTWVRCGLEAFGVISMPLFYGAWMKRGFKFEETGVFTSTTFRGMFSKFNPFRK